MSDQSSDPVMEQLREQISETDLAILEAINRRVTLVQRLHDYKAEQGYDLIDTAREDWIVQYLQRCNRGPISADEVERCPASCCDLRPRRETSTPARRRVALGRLPGAEVLGPHVLQELAEPLDSVRRSVPSTARCSPSSSIWIALASMTSSAAKIGGVARARPARSRRWVGSRSRSRAVAAQRDARVERVVAQVGDGDLHDSAPSSAEHVGEEVVRHGPRRLLGLQAHEDRGRLGMPDPDRQEAVAVGRLQEHDRLLADHVERDAVDDGCFLRGQLHDTRRPEAEPARSRGRRSRSPEALLHRHAVRRQPLVLRVGDERRPQRARPLLADALEGLAPHERVDAEAARVARRPPVGSTSSCRPRRGAAGDGVQGPMQTVPARRSCSATAWGSARVSTTTCSTADSSPRRISSWRSAATMIALRPWSRCSAR